MRRITGVMIALLLIGLCAFALADVPIDAEHFPDENFRSRLSVFDIKDDRKGILSDEEIASVTQLNFSTSSLADLTGIGYLTSLKTLSLVYSQVAALDLSRNTMLEEITCRNNEKLQAITLGNNGSLKKLDCYDNKLKALDLSGCTALETVSCYSNELQTLILGNKTQLRFLDCHNNGQLTTLDLTGCSLLLSLIENGSISYDRYYNDRIRGKDQDGKDVLLADKTTEVIFTTGQENLAIDRDRFPDPLFRKKVAEFDKTGDGTLNPIELGSITEISFGYSWETEYSDMESLSGIEYFTNLETLNCSNKKIAELYLSRNKKLTSLNCYNNRLKVLDISENPALTVLDCGQNRLISLNTSKNPALASLTCSDNQITDLSLGANKNLQFLDCKNNELQKLDLRKNTLLATLDCSGNGMTSLKLSTCKSLDCSNNKFTALDVTACKELVSLFCSQNQLSGIDLTPFTQLTDFSCASNRIIKLDLSKNKQLKNLNCTYNQLSALNISKNKKLMTLYCYDNNIIKVDISKCGDLLYLINNSQRQMWDYGTTIQYDIENQNLHLHIDKFVTIKAGSTTIPGEGDPEITGDFSDSTGNYKVEKDEEGHYSATFVSPPDKNAKSLVIPATIRVAGVKVKVTAVDKKACYKMKKLTKIEIGSNVSKIGASAFAQCAKLKTITVETKKLKDGNVGKKAFDGIYKKPTFKCPKGYAETYEEIFSKKGAPKKAKYK